MTLPNFLIIGAGKSGTTSLYHYLKQHPEIFMSPVKEPKFFALEGVGIYFRGPGDKEVMTQTSDNRAVLEIGEYERLFDGAGGAKALGEASPIYLHSPQAPARIRHYIPDAKLVAVLRNPIDRAYSAYLHQVRDGREWLGFREAMHAEEGRIQKDWAPGWRYQRVGFYHEHLSRYYELFGADNIRVHLYEDLSESPVSVSQDIFRFLRVDDSFVPDISLRHNVSGIPKSKALVALIKRPNPLKSAAKAILPEKTRKRLSMNLQNRNLSKAPPMPEETRMELIAAYREDVLKLQDLIGRDLSGWLAVKKP
jgi:hypothetical protein